MRACPPGRRRPTAGGVVRRLRAFSIILLCGACDQDPSGPGAPASLIIVGPIGQTATVGTALSQPVVVEVTDATGRAVANVQVSFSVLAGGGSFSPATVSTGSDGRAQASWTLGTTAGAQSAQATVSGVEPQPLTATAVPDAPASVAITPDIVTFTAGGGTAQLAAAAADRYDNAIPGAAFTWTSADDAIATVSATGLVTSQASGSTEVSAHTGSATGVAAVSVNQVASSMELTPAADTLNAIGDTLALVAAVRDSADYLIPGAAVTWTSSDAGVAEVDVEGRVVSKGTGTAQITGTSASVSASASIHVRQLLASVSVSPAADTLALGATRQLAANGYDSRYVVIPDLTFTWTTTSPEVATVSATGEMTAVGLGSALVTAAAGDESGSANVHVTPPPGAVVAAGSAHACALDLEGYAYCWGSNTSGQLGSSTSNITPVAVTGGHAFVAIRSRNNFTCAMTAAHEMYCWGSNGDGQLGDGTKTNRHSPVPVATAVSFRQFSVGSWHSCALTAEGQAYCWGFNFSGQLGDGTNTERTTPTAVATDLTFASIATGGVHTCALTADGTAYCWGSNGSGQVGDGSVVSTRTTPTAVDGQHSFASIHGGGSFSCGITTGGAAYCWGANLDGQVGDGGLSTAVRSPTAVVGDHAFSSLDLGRAHGCGIAGGIEYCWGSNFFGQLGDGTRTQRSAPSPVTGGLSFTALAAGDAHSCGVAARNVYCWGYRELGRLGDGVALNRTTPGPVSGAQSFDRISAGSSHSCAVAASGMAFCWGSNESGQLGDGTLEPRTSPHPVAGGLSFAQVEVGARHSCGLTTDGAVYCWGSNSVGRLGNGTTTPSAMPVAINSSDSFATIAVGADHSCAIRASDAIAFCWGFNGQGRLGDGTTESRASPTQVSGIFADQGFKSISAGGYHTCAVASLSATAYCWGDNTYGQLGSGITATYVVLPRRIESVQFARIAAGDDHSCGVGVDAIGYCWGRNENGRLGDNTLTQRSFPTLVAGGLSYGSITPGYLHTCGITTAGVGYCWGWGADGRLGNGDFFQRSVPVPVAGGHTFGQISAGGRHSCGLKTAGEAHCWGARGEGLLGDGVTIYVTSPIRVAGGMIVSATRLP